MRSITFSRASAALLAATVTSCDPPAPTQNVTVTQTRPAEPASAPPAPSVPPAALGKPGTAGGVQFTVTGVTTPDKIGSGGSANRTMDGETFVVVDYTLKNVGDAPLLSRDRPALALLDERGRAYAQDDSATMSASIVFGEDSSGATADLNPNVSARTRTAWKVDKSAFDRGTWRLAVATKPQLTFALK